MMSIQWYPGHMVTAKKEISKVLAQIDVVVEILDVRIAQASRNPMLAAMRLERQRPCLYILNKADLADVNVTKAWQQQLVNLNSYPAAAALAISALQASDIKKIVPQCRKLAPYRNSAIKPLRLLILGIPNVGKSTIINALAKRKLAATANQPAVTKQVQRYDINSELVIFDTPGLMWPKIDDEKAGLLLAAAHTLGVAAYDPEEVALHLGQLICQHYPDALSKRYQFHLQLLDENFATNWQMNSILLLNHIANYRNLPQISSIQGKFANLPQAALVLLNDFRSGILGRISLERVGV